MPRIDTAQFYAAAFHKHGKSPRGLHWHSQEYQSLRFETILSLLPSDISSLSIGDAGCGFGDFYTFLHKKPKKYIGIDSLKNMQEIAQTQTKSTIILADITQEQIPTMDYYICSGALNILTPFESHQFIANCYKSSIKGFIFNALHGDKESKTYNYLTKKSIETIANDLKVAKIVYKEGYLPLDITVGFYK